MSRPRLSPASRPPAGSDASAVLESWLPQVWAHANLTWEGDSPTLRLSLSGPGGGEWQLRVADGELRVEPMFRTLGSRLPDPDIWVRMSAADFLAVPFPSEDLIEFLPAHADLADLLFASSDDLELLDKLDGRVKFELEGRRRRRWAVDAAFGPLGMRAGRPRTTVSIDSGTCEKLAAHTLTPLQALLAGRLRVDGDRTLALQVLMLVASRMGG
ncbi:MAG: SCP2 sterol-binding domain-containing protein [Deltaproteobacteria bacterium]|nr:SCP2 sterol-binding domain-containing protein [Deltaproteobacteria bacterium]